jgi:DNA-binding CsgD family transcriptional regulator
MRRPIALDWQKPASDNSLRDSGLDPIGQIPWGTHICMFCETRQDLIDAVISYFVPAQRLNEYCLWVVSDPLSVDDAEEVLRKSIPGLAPRIDDGCFEIVSAQEWYYENGRFEWHKVVNGWNDRLERAQKNGFDGLRACGNPLWRTAEVWRDIAEYEHALEATLAGKPIIMLCTYTTEKSRPEDILDVAQAHQCVVARRHGVWQFLQVPGNAQAEREIKLLNGDLDALPAQLARGEFLTDRERVVLAQIVKGASSKEAARLLGISPRTVEFHRANIMQKLGAKNTAELVRMVLEKR